VEAAAVVEGNSTLAPVASILTGGARTSSSRGTSQEEGEGGVRGDSVVSRTCFPVEVGSSPVVVEALLVAGC